MIKKITPKSEFTRNVLTLMTGTTIAQAIPIAISPILTRIYTPDDFGIMTLYLSISNIFIVIATGKYELAIMLPEEDGDAVNVLLLSMGITIIISLISFFTIIIFGKQIALGLGNIEIQKWLYFLPVSVFFSGVYQAMNLWTNRKKKYKNIAASNILRSSSVASMNIGIGYFKKGAEGLIVGIVAGQIIPAIYLWLGTYSDIKQKKESISISKVLFLAQKYKKFPLLNLPNSLIDIVRYTSINLLISSYFTNAILGQYSLAMRLLQFPSALIGASLSQVFFQKISESRNYELNRIISEFIVKSALFSFPVFLFLYLYSIDIFIFVFGNDWRLAGSIASILSPWFFLNFISSPISTVFLVINKQEVVLIFSILYMLVPILIILIFKSCGFLYVLKLISIVMSCMLTLFIFLSLFYTAKK
jgi:O-antigen/teichoic acid export membrane protein